MTLTVSTPHGTSNGVSFTILWNGNGGNTYSCPTPGYGSNPYNYNNSYNNSWYCPPQGGGNTSAPQLSYLSPNNGASGSSVTIYGSGFTTTGNTVHFGIGILADLHSYDGTSLSFIVPSTLSGYGSQPVYQSTYQVSVTNGSGYSTHALPFTVTGTPGTSGAPTISSVTGPNSLAIRESGTWTVNVNAQSNQYLTFTVDWGDQNVYPMTAAQSQTIFQTNTLTHAYLQSGTYTIRFSVQNGNGQSNQYTTTVIVGGGSYNNSPYVSIANMAFNPQTIYVSRGTTVSWTNNDSMSHTVTSDTNNFGSAVLNSGQSYSYTFNSSGTYHYHCAIHPSMTGTVVVQ
jgi:plastocyanin